MLLTGCGASTTQGKASWYSLPGNLTANGERMDPRALTAAHRHLPFGTLVKVRNMENDKIVVVRINDRGPFKKDRIIDVSKGAAEALDMVDSGLARVRISIIK